MPRSLLIVLGLLWLPLLLSPACAKSPDGSPASAAQISERIDALFDPSTFAFGSGVLAIVENGEVTVLKGYGFEDAGRTRPTDPAETRFRIGSVSKTFAGLAIAQLLAEGKISSFDDPVSMYLPNVALGQNGRPITLRDLLTHEAGFAEGDFPYQHGARSTPAADAYMTRAAPPLLYPPGAVTGYSNYGAALVGHVVAAASGMSFEAYLNTRVFGPAGMGHSLYADTPKAPPRLAYAASYYPNGDAISHPSDWALDTAIAPAGSVVSSGADMAAYMIGLLQDSPLTTPAVREAAFTRLGGPHPQVQGYGSLFMLNQWGNERVVEHGGYLPGYRSYLVLFPERRVGVFVAVSGEPGPPSLGGLLPPPFRAARYVPKAGAITRSPSLSELRAASIEPVLGRYPKPEGGVLEAGAPDLSAYAGSYLAARRNPSSRDLWIQTLLLGAKMDVRATPDGLQVGGLAGYKPIGKDMFWREPKPKSPSGWYDLLVFRRDADGRIRDFSFLYSDTVWEPVHGIGSPPGAMALLPLGLLGLLTGLFVGFWPRGAAGKWFIWLAPFATIATPLLFFVGWPDAPDTVFRWLYRDAGSRLPFLLGAHAAAGLLLATVGAAAATLWRPRAQHLATAVAVRVHAGILLASAAVTLAAFWGLNWIL